MTTTISLDFTTITFESDYLDTGLVGIDLIYTKNCGDDVTVNLDSAIPSINNTTNTLELTVSDIIEDATIFPDGVYKFQLRTFTTNTDLEWQCIYIGTTSRCKARDLFMADDTTDVTKAKLEMILFALENATLCDTCSCANMCILYDELLYLIDPTNTTTSTSNDTTDCGC